MLNTSRTWAEVDLSALTNNFNIVKHNVPQDCKVCAVVKANAYGHGALAVAKCLDADWFATATLGEAIELREGGIDKPILILGYTAPDCAELLVKYKLTQTVMSLSYATKLNSAVSGTVRCHIKLDTGMGRIGFPVQTDDEKRTSVEEIKKVASLENLYLEGIFTHFAVSDTVGQEEFTRMQIENYKTVVEMLESSNLKFELKHCANSAAALRYPEATFDMVRLGIVLYGLQPDGIPCDNGLKPVMSLKTRVTLVKKGTDGGTISYGRKAESSSERKYASLAIGYADGYSTLHTNKGRVIINGCYAPVVGRVCMDQAVVDVTDIPGVSEGDIATVMGRDGECVLTAEDLAAEEGKINYEVICEVGHRVPRVYKR